MHCIELNEMTSEDKKCDIKWLTLECNDEAFTKYVHKIGVDESVKFVHILGFDEDDLKYIADPIMAIVFLYPIKLDDTIKAETCKVPKDLYYMKQSVGNSCGTVAAIHAIANCDLKLAEDSILSKFIESTKGKCPMEISKLFEANAELSQCHDESARSTQAEDNDEDQSDLHFICYVSNSGRLYELDGRKDGPIDHGECEESQFLKKAIEAIKKYTQDGSEIRFSALGLVKSA
ncbi:hypothetical protein GJ496_002253 [Pomphorhynchus laevis]|nr:hypothetical protein GJ496_002253 [Pomphorhynchus laevis]